MKKITFAVAACIAATTVFAQPQGGMPGGGFGGFGGGGAAGMFSAYTVASYDEEITVLKKWFHDRIAFLDRNWKN